MRLALQLVDLVLWFSSSTVQAAEIQVVTVEIDLVLKIDEDDRRAKDGA